MKTRRLTRGPVILVLGLLAGPFLQAESYLIAGEKPLGWLFQAGALDLAPDIKPPLSEALKLTREPTFTRATITRPDADSFFVPLELSFGPFLFTPPRLTLTQVPQFITTRKTPGIVLQLGPAFYATLVELKAAVALLPKGTEIVWARTCDRYGGEPLDEPGALLDFMNHCAQSGVILTLFPSG